MDDCGDDVYYAGKEAFTLTRTAHVSTASIRNRKARKKVTADEIKPFPQVLVTEQGIQSQTVPDLFEYDEPKTSREHFHNFCDIAGAKLRAPEPGKLSLVTGVTSGLVVIQIGKGRGSFVPNLNPGRYGVEHTANGNLLTKTKRIVDLNTRTTHIIFGIVRDQWLDGLNSCTLVQPDLNGRGPIRLLAEAAEIPIEPTAGYRFYTPFWHIPGAGSGFITKGPNGALKSRETAAVYPPYQIGIMTLDRPDLSEILRAFNEDWTNGSVFARKNPAAIPADGGNGGLEIWC